MIIGIDLGTTNCTLAVYDGGIQQFSIPQQMPISADLSSQTLPSFYFFPLEEEDPFPIVGHLAQERGAELPNRVIASAKSWLCHDGIDRRAPFLPLGDFKIKESPIAVCASYLSHLGKALEKKYGQFNINTAENKIYITVPASFDPSARQLVQEAAAIAGMPSAILIEEPLAAFYAWLERHQEDWRTQLQLGDVVLVIDIGGGTTDFSLIAVEENSGDLSLQRLAVGDHLLLGGDNIDLRLAYYIQDKLQRDLDNWQFQSLIHSCRKAKEILLTQDAPSSIPIQIQSKGSSLIRNTLSTTLDKKEIESLLVDGFFPHVPLDVALQKGKHSALGEYGLPFSRDPRITAHLAAFLSQAGSGLPTAVLFNGGTMKSDAFQQRILEILSSWRGEAPHVLLDADLDFAVSHGAVYYGWTRSHGGIRVRAGTSRAYFIGVESAAPAVPGVSPPVKAVCLVPFGMEEGEEVVLENERFNLFLDEAAVFRFFSCPKSTLDDGTNIEVGTTIVNWKNVLTELHSIETVLHKQQEGSVVQVKLAAKITEMGMMELWCLSENHLRWKLEFDIRKDELTAN